MERFILNLIIFFTSFMLLIDGINAQNGIVISPTNSDGRGSIYISTDSSIIIHWGGTYLLDDFLTIDSTILDSILSVSIPFLKTLPSPQHPTLKKHKRHVVYEDFTVNLYRSGIKITSFELTYKDLKKYLGEFLSPTLYYKKKLKYEHFVLLHDY